MGAMLSGGSALGRVLGSLALDQSPPLPLVKDAAPGTPLHIGSPAAEGSLSASAPGLDAGVFVGC